MPRVMKLMRALRWSVPPLVIGAAPGVLQSQNEATLRQTFEGQTVAVKLDMPGTDDGVNVYPKRSTPLEFPKVANALKEYGTAIRSGESQMITKIRVKKNLIEVHLGGGGYGTFSDMAGGPSHISTTEVGKTSRERQLEDALKKEKDKNKRKTLQRELDDLRAERSRENSRAQADAEQANRAADADERQRRAQGGSRFNIRFDEAVPAKYLTPEGVMLALEKYVTFSAVNAAAAPADTAAAEEPLDGVSSLKKGMSLAEVERLLGPAAEATSADVGGLTVLIRTYMTEGQRVRTRFANGVLVEYTVHSD